MGRLDRIKKAQEASKQNSFNPLDLNEGNVQAIFNRCLATESTTEFIKSILQQVASGHKQDSNPILFDKKKLLENLKHIRYLYGQLLTTHKHTNTINTGANNASNVMNNYLEQTWTENKRNINAIFPFRSWI